MYNMKQKKLISLLMAIIVTLSLFAPLSVLAQGETTITIPDVNGTAGSTVDVEVQIENNPGILGATLTLTFDEGLSLVSATNGTAFSALTMTRPGIFTSPCNLAWDGQELSEADISDGVIVTLQFKIPDDAQAGTKYNITASYEDGAIVNNYLNPVNVTINNGSIEVLDFTYGDLNADQKINTTDVIMHRRHIAGGYEQVINEQSADVNVDTKINATDTILIRRYIAGGYGVTLPYLTSGCNHVMEEIPAKEATEETEGNIAYWHCKACGKYFSDAQGKTEIMLEETIIPKVEGAYHTISYDISNGDSYLAGQQLENPNPSIYYENQGLTLKNLSAPGYTFLGWYDGAGNNAEQVKKIPVGATEDLEIYAHWEKIVYEVQLKSDIFIETDTLNYTVDKGVALPTPKLSNYIFTGWSDDEGNLYRGTSIPVGTTGNIRLTANWTSERNKTVTKTILSDPIIAEDEENILFAYEIGEVQNVPIYTIKDFGYISGDGIQRTATETYSLQTDEVLMSTYTETVSNATTNSSNWTLSSSWNDVTSVNEQWIKEEGKDISETDTVAKSNSNTWNISSGRTGSTQTSTISTDSKGMEQQVQIYGSKENTEQDQDSHTETDNRAWNINAKLSYTPKSYSAGIGVEGAKIEGGTSGGLGGEIGGGYEHSWGTEDSSTHTETETNKKGFELSGKVNVSNSSTNSTIENASWNSSQSYGGSSSISESKSISYNLSEKISQAYGYGREYARGEEHSEEQGHSSTQTYEDGYSSSVTYSKIEGKEITSEWTTQATKAGYHRWIVAGTAHVFGVVGYNIPTNSYYVYTYSVMDDDTYEFEDYSYTSAHYDDNENGVISFEIPYEVAEYVAERTCASEGLKVDLDTGIITEYNGTDTCVVIPEYFNTGTGDMVKITGIASDAFSHKENIEAVVLSDFITEIPDNAFEGCTSLIGVSGGNIQKIGKNAFSGCIAAKECGISDQITELGETAFKDVETIIVNAANQEVISAAVNSGAKQIIISLAYLNEDQAAKKLEINVPEGTEYFELNGNKDYTYNGYINSDANFTVINKVNLECDDNIPLKLSSSEIILNQSSMSGNGLSAVFTADAARVGLQGTISFVSENENALLCKQAELYEANSKVVGHLNVSNVALVCGDIINDELLTGTITTIDIQQFDDYLSSTKILFDANGGSVPVDYIMIPNNSEIGELPIASRDYYTFDGWYTEPEGGELVTSETFISSPVDVKLYAHWIQNDVSAWTLASEMPADAEVVDQKWSYTLTSYTTSSSSSLSGWERYNSTWVWSNYGSWSDWVNWNPGSSDSRQSESRWIAPTYKTQWNYSGYFNGTYSTHCAACGGSKHNGAHYVETGWLDYQVSATGKTFNCPNVGTVTEYRAWVTEGRNTYVYTVNTRQVETSAGYTQWRYRDRSKIYTYYYKKSEGKESASYPSGDNISNIQEWVQYRVK